MDKVFKNMKILNLTDLYRLQIKEIEDIFRINYNKMILEFPLEMINYTNSHLDIASDYLDAAYIAEELGRVTKKLTIAQKYNWPGPPGVVVKYTMVANDLNKAAKTLYNLSKGVYDRDEEFCISIHDFEDMIQNEKVIAKFPELIDSYFANYVGGLCELSEDEYDFRKEFWDYPERRYGFWKSPVSKLVDQDLYSSIHGYWLVPRDFNIKVIYKYLGFSTNPVFQEAYIASTGNRRIVYNKNNIIEFPDESSFFLAQKCSSDIFEKNEELKYCYLYNSKITDCSLTKEGGTLALRDSHCKYIFFDTKALTLPEIQLVCKEFSEISNGVNDILGNADQISCQWDMLNDEKFEELCYDVIYNYERFDYKTIRKMGKSRSRDGGRDIVVWTKERAGKKQKKFIFQCKLISVNSTLSGTKIQMADTVTQYGAQGYGIITSGVIDSTLYDKLDGISGNYNIEIITLSRFELERYLARNLDIKKRYFP